MFTVTSALWRGVVVSMTCTKQLGGGFLSRSCGFYDLPSISLPPGLITSPNRSGEAILDHGLGVIPAHCRLVSSHPIRSSTKKTSSPAEDEIGSMWESEFILMKCETMQVHL